MLVAVIDQSTGTSTSFCSKIVLPLRVGNRRGAALPLHFVVGRNALFGKAAGKGQSLLGVGGLEGGAGSLYISLVHGGSSLDAKIGETTPLSRRFKA